MKAFSESQKLRLREQLLLQSRKLFERNGFKKTSVDEITQKTGIARGSFYAFFESKEDLFFELLQTSETTIQNEILDLLSQDELSVEQSVTRLLRLVYTTLETHPLLAFAQIRKGEFEVFVRGLSDEKRQRLLEQDRGTVEKILAHYKNRGCPLRATTAEFTGLLRHAATSVLEKEAIGEEVFDAYVEWAIQSHTAYLVSKE